MSTSKFYLDFRGKAKDGKGSLLLMFMHCKTSTSIPLGIRLSRKEWNGERVVNRADSRILNAQIGKKKSDFDVAFALLSSTEDVEGMTACEIKKLIMTDKVKKKTRHTLTEIFDEYIQSGIKENTKDIYRITLKKAVSFSGEDTCIEDINLKWLMGFNRFLAKTQSVNGRSIYLRALRRICNYAKDIGLTNNYAFEKFSIKTEPTKKRSIDIDKLREFYHIPLPNNLARYRDFFFLMLFLIGINAIDLFLATPDMVNNGRLDYVRHKTGKKYSIKIEPEAQELLDKYKGEKYLVNIMDTCKSYKNFLHEMNDALKTIGPSRWEMVPDPEDLFGKPKLVKINEPIVPEITSYSSRHTWATIAYEIGLPMDIISQALGHSMGNRTTLIYIKNDQRKVDEANRQLIDYLIH